MSELVHPMYRPQQPGVQPQVRPFPNVQPVQSSVGSVQPMKKEPMQPSMQSSKPQKFPIVLVLLVLVLAVGTGFMLSRNFPLKTKSASTQSQQQGAQSATKVADIEVGKTYGSKDTKSFPDEAEGVLLRGGANGEGSHKIVREGGESQTVYLTSSNVDLDKFENHKVHIWGETFKAQRAGWLMDVGQVQVVELNAALPSWAQKEAEKAEKQTND